MMALETRCLNAWRECALSKLPQILTPEELVRIVLAEARVAELVEALQALVKHCHEQERQLTEELYRADFCGESGPLIDARAVIAKVTGQ